MRRTVTVRLTPEEHAEPERLAESIAASCGVRKQDLTGFIPLRESLDARRRDIRYNLTVEAFVGEPCHGQPEPPFLFKDVSRSDRRVVIVGAGPAGLFAALRCLELGIRPMVIERGKDVRARRRDLALLNRQGVLDEDSNYCFGEGGAGTYSDGKLYTRSSKRGDVGRILSLFIRFGASPGIRYEAHPHIGTNKLPGIISAMRDFIVQAGGIIRFGTRMKGLEVKSGRVDAILTGDGERIEGEDFVLATGHSARDVFTMLAAQGILIETKPLALGVRVEHPQSLIDRIQYHCMTGAPPSPLLPPAAYQLVEQVEGKGVFSFCMCPGGIVATASTSQGELVLNGWSPSRRNNPFANSGMVVQLNGADAFDWLKKNEPRDEPHIHPDDPLLLMRFQQRVEQRAYEAGGGAFRAPAQRLTDLIEGRASTNLPDCSYVRGIRSARMDEVLPGFIHRALRQGFQRFGRKMQGYATREAVVLATESRTSSPVRIPRDPKSLNHPHLTNLYPCGEGAGYAGGIVSAAMDGERVVEALALKKT
jgi:uncharacterized FAD-dependent dehydrogenase